MDPGNFTPPKFKKVGSKSTAEIEEVSSTPPAAIFPGQRAMNGTPIPPSNSSPLYPFLPPVTPREALIPYPAPVAGVVRQLQFGWTGGSCWSIVRAEDDQCVSGQVQPIKCIQDLADSIIGVRRDRCVNVVAFVKIAKTPSSTWALYEKGCEAREATSR